METHAQRGTPRSLEETVAKVCELVARDDSIGVVHVLYPESPSFAQAILVHEFASTRGLELSIDDSGDVIVKRTAIAAPTPDWHMPKLLPTRANVHIPNFRLPFPELNEGTR
jgi:hypothetical protein